MSQTPSDDTARQLGLTKSSPVPYVVGILVLLLLSGVLLWATFWRKPASASAPMVTSASVKAPVETAEPRMAIDIPAPPPIAEEPDATPPKSAIPGKSLCASPCEGSAPPALRSALSASASAARGCYERALRTDPTLEGRMTVAVRVASNGSVCSASIANSTLRSSQVNSCVTGLFTGKRFPAVTEGRCADVHVPLSFTPKHNK